jgi:hypothetical protein
MKDLRHHRQSHPGLVDSIRNGLAVPILSDEALLDLVLPGHSPLVQAYVEYTGYPLSDQENLPRVARWYKLKRQRAAQAEGKDFTASDLRVDFFDFVKNFVYAHAEADCMDAEVLKEAERRSADSFVTEFARLLDYPCLDKSAADSLQVLANLPFRVLLTTSPFTFLEEALEKAGKTPRITFIRWRKDLRDLFDGAFPDIPAGGDPTRFPLVCHLFGLDRHSNSLVLTEDDYLEFLVDVNLTRGENTRDSVPSPVRKALSGDLLVLGFSLNSWAFRALYAGLIKSDDTRTEKRGICVQLPPSEVEKAYLDDYLQREARFDVAWQPLDEFIAGLLTM